MPASGSHDHCCVPCCDGDARKHEELHFHQIPKNANMKKKWVIQIRRDIGPSFKVTNNAKVCSRHFLSSHYRLNVFGPNRGKLLKRESFPTEFPWTNSVEGRPNIKDKIRARETDGAASSGEENGNEYDTDQLDKDETDRITLTADQQDLLTKAPIDIVMLWSSSKLQLADTAQCLADAKEEIEQLRASNIDLCKQMKIERFGLYRYSTDNKLIKFYTGFNSYDTFMSFLYFIRVAANTMQSAYHISSQDISQAGRKSCMPLEDELFMFLCGLWSGLQSQDLADRFHCSMATVSRKIITWANLLYFILGSINIWLPRNVINYKLPSTFKGTTYDKTRIIIDCTEIKIQMPSSLVLNSQTYSSYKSANTLKCLVGIAPHGAVTFVSTLYTGCMSDVEITRICGLLDLLEEDDVVMADKGFTIQKDCESRKASLNIPPFLRQNNQFTPSQVSETQEIATLRIHVERAIQRIKDNNLFKMVIPLNMVGTVCQLWTVAVLLTNFQGPLIIERT